MASSSAYDATSTRLTIRLPEGPPTTLTVQLPGGTSASKPPKPCGLKWDRERTFQPYDPKAFIRPAFDYGELVTLEELAAEMSGGCDKCAIIYSGIKKYRHAFQDDDKAGAYIYKTTRGVSCDMKDSKMQLEFFVGNDDGRCKWLPEQKFPKLATNTGSAESISTLCRWLDDCELGHEACARSSKATLPARILDLKTAPDETARVQLCNGDGKVAEYATLSHCWGSYMPLKTTTATLAKHQHRIEFHQLPKTFRDAVLTCRRLGIQYLWIDALCIIQDDEADWQTQSAEMAAIYGNSKLTLAAVAAQDATQGCFLADTHTAHTLAWPGTAQGGAYSVHVRRRYPHPIQWFEKDMTGLTPLFDRAWFHQERFLSRRVVHFTAHELWWECSTIAICECGNSASHQRTNSLPEDLPLAVRTRTGLRSPLTSPSAFWGQPSAPATLPSTAPSDSDPWHLTIRLSSHLALSRSSDIFPALSGLAARLQPSKPGLSYYAGMWLTPATTTTRGNLNDLLWLNDGIPATRVPRWRAPTWSWASITGCFPSWPVWIQLDPLHIYARLEHASVKLAGTHALGEVRDAHIRILGPMEQGFINKPTVSKAGASGGLHPIGAVVYIPDEPNPGGMWPLVRLDVDFDRHTPAFKDGEPVYCLRLGRVAPDGDAVYRKTRDVSLCLRKLRMEGGEMVFERIGVVTHSHIWTPKEGGKLFDVKIY